MQDEEQTRLQEIEQRYAALREAGLKIDPSTAEVKWEHGSSDVVSRPGGWVFFARAPMSDVWVSFDDLPDEICKALWRRLEDEDPFAPTPDVLMPTGLDGWEQIVIRMAEARKAERSPEAQSRRVAARQLSRRRRCNPVEGGAPPYRIYQ
jgi:hypothetical protein